LSREKRRGDAPLFFHPDWVESFPWLVQGTTGREAGDFASFGSQSAEALQAQWKRLRSWTQLETAVLGRQVHGAHVMEHGALSAGMLFADDSDGHITAARGVLLAVSIADCVPVFVVDA
jgi:copper oxidase (laccase) domain-containing protein